MMDGENSGDNNETYDQIFDNWDTEPRGKGNDTRGAGNNYSDGGNGRDNRSFPSGGGGSYSSSYGGPDSNAGNPAGNNSRGGYSNGGGRPSGSNQESEGGYGRESGYSSSGRGRGSYGGQQNSGYQKGGYGGKGGGYGNKGGYGKGNFQRKPPPPITIYLPYTVLFDDKTPPEVVDKVIAIARFCESRGFTMRATPSKNPDNNRHIEQVKTKEVVVPWNDFNDYKGDYKTTERGKELTGKMNLAFDKLKPPVQAIVAHNTHAILGQYLNSPSHFVLMWTPDGVEHIRNKTEQTGFMYGPIKICNVYGIPIFNLHNRDAEDRIRQHVGGYLEPIKPQNNPGNY